MRMLWDFILHDPCTIWVTQLTTPVTLYGKTSLDFAQLQNKWRAAAWSRTILLQGERDRCLVCWRHTINSLLSVDTITSLKQVSILHLTTCTYVRMATSGNKQAHITTVRSSASLDILCNICLEKQPNQQQIKCYEFVLSLNLTELNEYVRT